MDAMLDLNIYNQSDLEILPPEERPECRVAKDPGVCTSLEILAAIVGGKHQLEIARALLRRFGSLDRLYKAHVDQIASVKGIGPQTAARIKAALWSGLHVMAVKDTPPSIHTPSDAADLVRCEIGLLEQEELWVILLDQRNRVIDIIHLYKGSLNSSQVRVGEVFKAAITRSAAATIVVHNHPSGDPTPSPDDVAVTRAIVQAGKLLDIDVLDHVIVAGPRFVSLKERGLGFG